MKRTSFMGLILAFILMFSMTSSISAADYSFALTQETVHVFLNADGTMALDYVLTFQNDSGASPIEYVDVGMPNDNYSGASADRDGNSLKITSDYQGLGPYGFAVEMGNQSIQPGDSGSLHVYVDRITGVLYPDEKQAGYASNEFSPSWFGSQYVHGDTNISVIYHLPPEIKPEEPLWHQAGGNWPCNVDPETGMDNNSRITYTWACPNANGYTQYIFGASFPAQYVPAGVISQATPTPFATTPSNNGFNFNLGGLMGWFVPCCFGGLFFGAPLLGVVNERKRKLQYMPPKISIEGHGIKRGLTAVEAAILMEQPLDKIMTMILFGAVKKGAAAVVTKDPLKLQITQPAPQGLQGYENEFLAAFASATLAEQRKMLQAMVVNLVNSVSAKMKGFSRGETVDYYKAIMERAWQQIEAAGTPEVKSDMYEQALEWTMLDKNYDERTRRTFTTGPVFLPMWWGNYDPGYRTATTSAPGMGTARSVGAGTSMPSANMRGSGVPGASFAASVIGGVQNFASRTIGDVSAFTSGVTNRTNPPPKPAASSGSKWSGGGGGGGHSCACACACAGCACACAGGGR
jgi:hypothetical protein